MQSAVRNAGGREVSRLQSRPKESGDCVTDYQQWIARVTREPHEPLTQERIDEMLQATHRAGSANGWTGTSGTLATMVRELLRERYELLRLGSEWRDE